MKHEDETQAVAPRLDRGVRRLVNEGTERTMTPLKTLLRNAREAKGWSLHDAADMIGTTKGHLHDLENGRSDNPTLRLVAALVIVYGLRPEAVVSSAIRGALAEREGCDYMAEPGAVCKKCWKVHAA